MMTPETASAPSEAALYYRDWRRKRRERRRGRCCICREGLAGLRKDARYCVNACRCKAYRQRKAAKEAAARRRADFVASLIG
jgi:hypothetical protein